MLRSWHAAFLWSEVTPCTHAGWTAAVAPGRRPKCDARAQSVEPVPGEISCDFGSATFERAKSGDVHQALVERESRELCLLACELFPAGQLWITSSCDFYARPSHIPRSRIPYPLRCRPNYSQMSRSSLVSQLFSLTNTIFKDSFTFFRKNTWLSELMNVVPDGQVYEFQECFF